MSKKIAWVFLICWTLIGLGLTTICAWTITDFILYRNSTMLVYTIMSTSGFCGYVVLALLFMFHKDFRK